MRMFFVILTVLVGLTGWAAIVAAIHFYGLGDVLHATFWLVASSMLHRLSSDASEALDKRFPA